MAKSFISKASELETKSEEYIAFRVQIYQFLDLKTVLDKSLGS
jgi:hypothetical protein